MFAWFEDLAYVVKEYYKIQNNYTFLDRDVHIAHRAPRALTLYMSS